MLILGVLACAGLEVLTKGAANENSLAKRVDENIVAGHWVWRNSQCGAPMYTQTFRSLEARVVFEFKFKAAMRFCNLSVEDFGWSLDEDAIGFGFGSFRIVEKVRRIPGRATHVRYNLEHYEATNLRLLTGASPYKHLQAYQSADEALTALVTRRVRDGIVDIIEIMNSAPDDEVEVEVVSEDA